MMRFVLLLALLAPVASAQLQLFVVTGGLEQPAPASINLGSVYSGESASLRFRLRNVSNAPAAASLLAVNGVGFTLSGGPPLPAAVGPQAQIEFIVTFQAATTGAYSAILQSETISTLLTAAVVPRLTYRVGSEVLTGTVSFGSIERDSSAIRRFTIENLNPVLLTVPAISVQGTAFRLAAASPSGIVLQPRDSAAFDVQFVPLTSSSHQGQLIIGDRSYELTGSAFEPPLPKPSLAVSLPEPGSAQQGSVSIKLDAASRTTGSGTLVMEFRPLTTGASDPAITFASGARTITFTVSRADTQPLTALFQTGTTAGSLIFTVTLGGVTDQQSITIAPAPIGIASVQAARSTGALEVRIAGYDNSRTAGPLAFTFFDASGSAIPIRADASAEFARHFQTSIGGTFLLRTVFPVTGDATQIAAVEVEFTTPAGVAKSQRTSF